jgi:chromosome segregation ATPase
MALRNDSLGLTRTDSGTIIPHMSKRPTPAPSEGGQTEIDDQDIPPAFQIPSPQATPTGSIQEEADCSDAGAEFAGQVDEDLRVAREQITQAAEDLQKAEHTFEGHVQELELQVSNGREREEVLTRRLEELTKVEGEVRDSLKVREEEIVRLSRELGEEREKNRVASLATEKQSEGMEAMNIRIQGLEDEMTAALANREALKAELVQEKEKARGVMGRLQTAETSLEESRVELMGAASQAGALKVELEEQRAAAEVLQAGFNDISRALDGERQRTRELEQALGDKDQELRHLQGEHSSLVTDIENVRREAMELANVLEKTRGELGEEATRRVTLETDVVAKSAELDRVNSLLEVEKGEATTLRQSIGRLEDVVRNLQAQAAGAIEKLDVAERSKVDQETKYTEEVQRLQKVTLTLEEQAGARMTELEEERRKTSLVEMEREELRALNVTLGAERLGLEIELESEKNRAADLEREAAARVVKEKALTSELEAVKMNWEMEQKKLQGERAMIDRVRQTQLGGWEQYDKEVRTR